MIDQYYIHPYYCIKCKEMVDVNYTTLYEKDIITHISCIECGHKICIVTERRR